MAWFGQGKDTIEWLEYRPDVLFYKWKGMEIKRGSHLIVRPGQKAIFYANGVIEGIFENEGNFDIESQILPFLSTLKGWFTLRGDTGLRAEVYFVNSKELLMQWGTRQRITIPTVEVPSGIPIGMNGTLVIEFRDYLAFISKVAGVRDTYSVSDISQRILGELDGIVSEAVLAGQQYVGVGVIASLQANSRRLGKAMAAELDKELFDIGLGIRDINIISVNYPEEIQKMQDKVASQAFVSDTGKYAALQMADGMAKGGGGGGTEIASLGAQMAMGAQLAQSMSQSMQGAPARQAAPSGGDRFCPRCRKMVSGKFCSDCGAETV
jgi:membrane protease subunit (stomatin/prohibitin family)